MPKKIYPHSYKLEIIDLSGGKEEAFEIYVPAFKAHIFGDTIQEALEGYLGFFDHEVELRKKEGIAMPKPDAIKQIPLRIPERVYQSISEIAKKKAAPSIALWQVYLRMRLNPATPSPPYSPSCHPPGLLPCP